MSGPTIRINDGAFPDVGIAVPGGSAIEISDINDFDLGLLGNQRKLGSTPPASSASSAPSGPVMTLSGGGGLDDVEVVDLDNNVSFDVKPISGPSTSDTIRILRDSAPPPPARPIDGTLNLSGLVTPAAAPAPAPAPSASKPSGWFSNLNPFSSNGGASSSSAPATESKSGWFSSPAPAPALAAQTEYLTPEQELAKKTEGLTLLERMDRKGVGGTKMTTANTLEEINAEVARRKDSKGLEASIRFQRSMLTTVTSGMEFLNSKYDPLGVALDGWSEQVNENIEDYDEIFEELYDKYKDKSKVAPEVRLIMSLGLSAAMCHVTNTMFKSKMPDMNDIMRKNPDLARQMARAAAEQAVGPGFANFVSMGMPGGGGGGAPQSRAPMPAAPMPSMPPRMNMYEEEERQPMMAPMGAGIGGPIPSLDPRGGMEIGGAPPMTARREMRGPTNVDDILQTLSMNGRGGSDRTVPPPAIDADDVASVASGMTSATDRRRGISRRRPAVAQPTGATLTLNV
jgi:hypothetical protein